MSVNIDLMGGELTQPTTTSRVIKKGANWSVEETRTFLQLCMEKDVLGIMDGKKHKHIDIFRTLIPSMAEKQFMKTAEQMQLKLKTLKLIYFKCKRANNVSGAKFNSFPYFEEMDFLYGYRPSSKASAHGPGIDTCANDNDNIKGKYRDILQLFVLFNKSFLL